VAYSCIPQGTCGDLINERGLNHIYYNQHLYKSVQLLTQVHDSIGLQIPLELSLVEHSKILIKIKESLSQPLEWKGHQFDVPVDLTVGFNLNKDEGTELKSEQFSNDPGELSIKLEESIYADSNRIRS